MGTFSLSLRRLSLRQNNIYFFTKFLWCTYQCEAGRGGRTGHGLGIWHFSKICLQIPCPRANHSSQMQPNSPTPGCTCQISQRWTQKGTIKISANKTLQSLFINVAASPKIHVPVTSAIICFDQSIRVTLHRIQKPLQESPHFVRLSITVLSKGYKESQFYNLTVIVANEPYTNQLYLQKSTSFLFTSVCFDTTLS